MGKPQVCRNDIAYMPRQTNAIVINPTMAKMAMPPGELIGISK
jgi:hypothetical protein